MVRRTTSALRCSIRLVCSLRVGRVGGRVGEGRREGWAQGVHTLASHDVRMQSFILTSSLLLDCH